MQAQSGGSLHANPKNKLKHVAFSRHHQVRIDKQINNYIESIPLNKTKQRSTDAVFKLQDIMTGTTQH
jgi:hypothetical protein